MLRPEVIRRRRRGWPWLLGLAVLASSFAVGSWAAAPAGPARRERAARASPDECGRVDIRATVSRVLLERWLAEPFPLARISTLVPSVRHGRRGGLELFGIWPGTPLAAVGLRNRDTIERIDGVALASLASALEVYQRLDRERPGRVVVELVRDRCPVTLAISAR